MRGKRIFMIALWLMGICLVVLLVLAGWENWRGKKRLARVINQIKSEGGSLDVELAFARNVPDAENAAVPLARLVDRLNAFKQSVAFPPRVMVMDAPGFARSYINAEGWDDALGNQYKWQQIENVRDEAGALIAELAEVAARPRFATPFDPSIGVADMNLESLPAMTGVTRVCLTGAMQALRDDDDPTAASALGILLNLYCNKAEDPIAIAQMVRWSQARNALGLTWEMLQHAELEDAQWLSLQRSWERCDFVADTAKTWEVEMAGVMDVYTRLKESSAYRQHVLDNFQTIETEHSASWNPPARGWLLKRVALPLWSLLWADQNHAEALEFAAVEWKLARFAQTNSWTATRTESQRLGREMTGSLGFFWPEPAIKPAGFYDRCRYLFATGPTLVKGSHTKRSMEAQTEAVMAATAIALKRQQLRHGELPAELGQLVPEIMPRVPLDPMDQQPFRYRRGNDGSFLLYSVGANGVDDGGSLETREDATPLSGKLWTSLDTVWPRKLE
jgi:hypothetical protein